MSPRAARHCHNGKGQLLLHASTTQPSPGTAQTCPSHPCWLWEHRDEHSPLSPGSLQSSGLHIPALIQSWGLTPT